MVPELRSWDCAVEAGTTERGAAYWELESGQRVVSADDSVTGGRDEGTNTLASLLSLSSRPPSLLPVGQADLRARGQRSLGDVISWNTEERKGRTGADLNRRRHKQPAHLTLCKYRVF